MLTARLFSLFLFAFALFAQALSAQYAKVTFESKTPFRIVVDGEKLHEEALSSARLRLNQGRTYQIEIFDKDQPQAVISRNIAVHEHEKKSSYKIKYNKRKKTYDLVAKSAKIKDPNAVRQPMTFTMETRETYSGPDGAYSKASKTDGSIGNGGATLNQKKASASADENGIKASAEEKNRDTSGLQDLAKLGKSLKRKKKDDGKTVVLLKKKKA